MSTSGHEKLRPEHWPERCGGNYPAALRTDSLEPITDFLPPRNIAVRRRSHVLSMHRALSVVMTRHRLESRNEGR